MREYKQDFHKHYRVHPLSREIIIFISTSAIFSTFALWIIPCYYLYYNRKRATHSKTSLFTVVCNGMFVFRRVGWSEVGNNVNIKRIWRCLRTRLNTSPVVNYSKRQRATRLVPITFRKNIHQPKSIDLLPHGIQFVSTFLLFAFRRKMTFVTSNAIQNRNEKRKSKPFAS